MIPTLVPKRFHHDGWVFKEKIEGWRILAGSPSPLRLKRGLG
jgi:hypothetical protein